MPIHIELQLLDAHSPIAQRNVVSLYLQRKAGALGRWRAVAGLRARIRLGEMRLFAQRLDLLRQRAWDCRLGREFGIHLRLPNVQSMQQAPQQAQRCTSHSAGTSGSECPRESV